MHLFHGFPARSIRHSVFRKDIFANHWMIWGKTFAVACADRSHRKIKRTPLTNKRVTVLAGAVIGMVLLVIVTYVPGLNDLLQMYPLNGVDWALIIGATMLHVRVCGPGTKLFN